MFWGKVEKPKGVRVRGNDEEKGEGKTAAKKTAKKKPAKKAENQFNPAEVRKNIAIMVESEAEEMAKR